LGGVQIPKKEVKLRSKKAGGGRSLTMNYCYGRMGHCLGTRNETSDKYPFKHHEEKGISAFGGVNIRKKNTQGKKGAEKKDGKRGKRSSSKEQLIVLAM